MEYEARVATSLCGDGEVVTVKRVRITADSEEDAREQLAKDYDLTDEMKARLKPEQIELIGDFWVEPPGAYKIGTSLGAGVVPFNVRCWSCSKELPRGFITMRKDGKVIYLVFCSPVCIYNYMDSMLHGGPE